MREIGERREREGWARVIIEKPFGHDLSSARELSASEAGLWDALQSITTTSAKAEILAVLDGLPDDCTMEDFLVELDEREHLRRDLASAIYEPLVDQEEVEAWVEQWARE